MSKTIMVTDADFDQKVLQSATPVLVDFWAPWCHPCMMAAPVLEELAVEYSNKLIIAKVNVDENAKSAQKYGVMAIPNMIMFKDGKKVNQIVGYRANQT